MSTSNSVKVVAPATVANVSCGFDILGFAVEEPGDIVEVIRTTKPGVSIKKIMGDDGRLPLDANLNTAGVAVISLLQSLKCTDGFEIVLDKKLPLGSGMGSSAASAVAALVAVNHLLGNPKTREELVPHAMEAERIACGAAHADNVAPSLLGGFVLIRDYAPLDLIKIGSPDHLYCTLVHPEIEVKTEDSRKVLKASVSMKDAITQGGNIAGLIAGLLNSDYGLISRSLKDVLAEPIRSVFIPGFDGIKAGAREAGALGSGISGSGPTIYALSDSLEKAERVGKAIEIHFKNIQLNCEKYVSKVNAEGAKILE